MEWKINRERIPVTERILDETQEQGVELDYVLPDYDPEIFRIIRCEMQPTILEYQLQETRLSYELQVDLRILYCGSDSHRLQCVTQTMHYTKTLDLPEKPESPAVLLQAKADYANCRAVSRRRLDVRGAVSVRVQITGERMQEVISDVFGMQVQCQKQTIAYASQKQRAVKTISLSEDIERNAAKAPIQSILRCTARAEQGEQSIIAGKFVVRGEVLVSLLYCSTSEEQTEPESMQFSLPYSQIIDMEQIDETFTGMAAVQVIRCECKPVSNKGGDSDNLHCEADLRITCTACKPATISIVTDAYSTAYLCDCVRTPLRIDGTPVPLKEQFSCTAAIPAGDTPVDFVSDLQCRIKNVSATPVPEQNRIRVSGMLCCSVLAKDQEGMPFLLEKEEAFEELLATTVHWNRQCSVQRQSRQTVPFIWRQMAVFPSKLRFPCKGCSIQQRSKPDSLKLQLMKTANGHGTATVHCGSIMAQWANPSGKLPNAATQKFLQSQQKMICPATP